jgi:16S rRNA (guanine527-N7)-methyltransferase
MVGIPRLRIASGPEVPPSPLSTRAAARLDDLVTQHGLDATARRRLDELLVALRPDEAPTAIHDPDRGVDVHLADSLAGLALPELREASRIADLGAGAGLPGLPLGIARPAARLALLESAGRKCRFIAAVAEGLGLTDVDVVHARAEAWVDGLASCDVVCARALAALPVLCEYAAPLLVPGGVLVAWKGDVDPREAADGHAAAERLGLAEDRVEAVPPLPGADRRTLHVYRKVAPTPPGFPRRPGIAIKRPLSART